MNETYNTIQNKMNSLLSEILNISNPGHFTYPQAKFSGNSTTIEAFQVYVFNGNDNKTPSGLLIQLLIINGQAPFTTTTPATTLPATLGKKPGHQCVTPTTASAVVQTRLVISNSSGIPCESLVNSVIRTLLNYRSATLPDSVTVTNYTYEKISDNSYAVNITFNISSIKIHGNSACTNSILQGVKTTINRAINKLLNHPNVRPLKDPRFKLNV
ncbi:hypothetical protein PGIGA_G00182730 [Pangasianodon gigas]|uniref:Uncharacterized protein n=1 Tax=Pangasianodon gigas TaxID=30993 RepID=A0ACC5WC94_PANGG|nr:hypothetical protein [Pangasianodon gigas]